ncbi:MAG: DNA polymerase III subunit delta [Epsilonproteobacteria bacterium]|nr:hypothetical protein [Campylobacterota bacterium]NPA56632.1 DNA polymerase III subunit delta [Campylobacterota bacterium]
MYKREFDTLLAEGDLPFRSFLFWGEEPYYVEKYGEMVARRLSSPEERLTLYYDEFEMGRARTFLSEASLFGNRNLLVVRGETPLTRGELEELLGIVERVPTSFFIYELSSTEGRRIAPLFSQERKGVAVRFFSPTRGEALSQLQKEAEGLGLSLDRETADHLWQMVGENLSLAVAELPKLALLGQNIGVKEIDQLVYPLTTLPLERIYVALLSREPLEKIFTEIEEADYNEIRILLGLEQFLQQLFLFNTSMKLFGKIDSKEILGYKLPPSVERERSRLAVRITKYREIFSLLQECEYLLKSGGGGERKGILYSYLIKLQALL